jgi:Holliday junction resolvase RusA-like endonuclease
MVARRRVGGGSAPESRFLAPGATQGAGGLSPDPIAVSGSSQAFWLMPDPRLVARLSPNARSQSHWPKTNARTQIMKHVATAARVQGLTPPGAPVRVTVRWIFPDRRKRDIDNLAANGTVKAILDALVEQEFLVDDSTQYVVGVNTVVEYRKGSRWLEVVIERVEV